MRCWTRATRTRSPASARIASASAPWCAPCCPARIACTRWRARAAASLGELERVAPAGCFAGTLEDDADYRLSIDWMTVTQEVEDTYAFGPLLAEDRLARLFAEGDPLAVLDCLGARPMSVDGVPGVRFALWAPNAARVSVVGDFNAWDGRRHPMRLRHPCGRVGAVRAAHRRRRALQVRAAHAARAWCCRSRPIPARAPPRRRPLTASVVADAEALSSFEWHDQDWMPPPRRTRCRARADVGLRGPSGILAKDRRSAARTELGRAGRPADSLRAPASASPTSS